MPSPFPGMNPYLEDPALWAGVHGRLIVALADSLSPQLRPKYFVAIEERIYETTNDQNNSQFAIRNSQLNKFNCNYANTSYCAASIFKPLRLLRGLIANCEFTIANCLVTVPIPQNVKERYLEVRRVGTKEVVTVVELLSPKNKRTGEGRNAYESKRHRVLSSSTNLVEIDLLRAGEPMPIIGNSIQSDYRILVSRGLLRPQADLYAFNLQNVIPEFYLPLPSENVEPIVYLQTLLSELYDRASYDLVIDYNQEPVPPLLEVDAAWADVLLREQGLR